MPGTPRYIWMEGELRPAAEGVVPFVNAGLHYGFSVFEGIRCYETQGGPAVSALMSMSNACSIPRWS
jgi:branched-chain amino acid aminotransferase